MVKKIQFDHLGRNSNLYRDFKLESQLLLENSEKFRNAQAEWEEFFTTSHGDVFDDIPLQTPETELFIDFLYCDFIIDNIIEFTERAFNFTISNQELRANTDIISFSFQELHDRVTDGEIATGVFDTVLSEENLLNADDGFLRKLYESIISREIRLTLGEYYTPYGVAELAVDALNVDNIIDATFLDPGCGSGVFNSVCIDRKIDVMQDNYDSSEILSNIITSVVGIDLNPVAVKSAKLNYLLSLLPLLTDADIDTIEIPVFLADALKLTQDETIVFNGDSFDPVFDYLVGNPPWITWERLSENVKNQWRDKYVDQLNLLPHEGTASRLGYANDDISVPYLWVCIHHYLRSNGHASFVMKSDIMKGPAGKLFRTLQIGERLLSMKHIHDFNNLRPFGDQVGANASIYTMEADILNNFPIETTSWTNGDVTANFSTASTIRSTLTAEHTAIIPLDDDDGTTTWIRQDAERGAIGECEQDIRHGVKDDAQEVFSIDREKLTELEPDLVYPYIKSKHVVKYGLFGHELRLVPISKANEDNEQEIQNQYPNTYSYLKNHQNQLEDRSSSWLQQGTFYNIFGLGDYTWSDYKVAWCRLGFKPHFAVISTVDDEDLGEKMVIPGDHYMFIPTNNKEEAHFLCALLNSSIYQRSLKDIASEGKASLSKSVVSQLEIPEFRETDESKRLAELSIEAHSIVPEYTDTSKRSYNKLVIADLEVIQAKIDRIVEEMLSKDGLFPSVGQSSLSTF